MSTKLSDAQIDEIREKRANGVDVAELSEQYSVSKSYIYRLTKSVQSQESEKPTEIVMTSPVEPSAQFVVASELADDEMIENELMGEVLPYYIYQFQQDGKPVTGMTVKGVNEVVRRLNKQKDSGAKIRISPEHMRIERDVEYDGVKGVEVSVYAENLIDGNSAWGIKFEPYKKKGRNGEYTNTFAVEKAISKAERNAKRKLIPETAAMKIIEKLIGEQPDGVKHLDAPPPQSETRQVQKPKPSTPEELKKVIIDAMHQINDPNKIIEFNERAQNDKRLNDEMKKEINSVANGRVDSLTNG